MRIVSRVGLMVIEVVDCWNVVLKVLLLRGIDWLMRGFIVVVVVVVVCINFVWKKLGFVLYLDVCVLVFGVWRWWWWRIL